jgi:imidazoleglycerol-phosphate dehydratase
VPRASGRVSRKARIDRVTKETAVSAQVNIDGSGKTEVKTGIAFIDHLLTSIGKHSLIDITLTGKSNDGIIHHLAEDVAITLSQAIDKALGERSRISRFGHAIVPMDESLAFSAIDLVKRQYQNIQLGLTRDSIEGVPREDIEHFVRSLAQNLNACTHIVIQYGENDHHKVEAALKAFAVALRMAVSAEPRQKGVPSTKGAM